MTNHNDHGTDQLEEVSGRWLRDQLRDVADLGQAAEASARPSGAEVSTSQLLDGLATSISAAVVEPIRGLESRREAQQKRLEDSVRELSQKLSEAFVEIARLRDQAAAATAKIDAIRAETQRELEAIRTQLKSEIDGVAMETKGELSGVHSELRRDVDQLGASSTDIRSGFNSLAEEIGRLQERVREQHEWLQGLRAREAQRANAMNELASALKSALAAAASLSNPNEAPASSSNQ
jgi:chromosome segregation ATPase